MWVGLVFMLSALWPPFLFLNYHFIFFYLHSSIFVQIIEPAAITKDKQTGYRRDIGLAASIQRHASGQNETSH